MRSRCTLGVGSRMVLRLSPPAVISWYRKGQ